jgi:hypothetical protein
MPAGRFPPPNILLKLYIICSSTNLLWRSMRTSSRAFFWDPPPRSWAAVKSGESFLREQDVGRKP